MSLSWNAVCVKYLIFIFNLLFVISGIIILSVGVSIKAYYKDYEIFLDDNYFSTSNLLIAIGTIIFLIAFFGCCGAVKENYCMVITFSTLLILVFILELAAGISGYVLRSKTENFLKEELTASLETFGKNSYKTKTWRLIQTNFQCCGVEGPKDWNTVFQNGSYPMSCCDAPDDTIGVFHCDNNSLNDTLHTDGCLPAFGNYVKDHAYTLGGVGLGFAIVQALGIVFACHLSRQIKLHYETV